MSLAALIAAAGLAATPASAPVEPDFYAARVIETYPHDINAFTQGLFFHEGVLFETTGQYGESALRRLSLETGEVLQATPLPRSVFGEGSVSWGGDIVVLTWRSGRGFVFDRESLEKEKNFQIAGEGWGLTHDGTRLIMSDGTDALRFLDPETFEETGRVAVTLRGRPLPNLNELEWIDGKVFANVWQTDAIVRIDPESGAVTGIVDLRGLLPDEDRTPGHTDVLNGIAYDPQTDRLFVTGKYWPTLFEIELVEQTP